MRDKAKYSDESLIKDLLSEATEVKAFERVFHKYYPMVCNFIKGMLKDIVLAEDVAQDIFMKLWLNRKKLNPLQSLKIYLCVIARNEVLTILSSKANRSVNLLPKLPEVQCETRQVDDWISFSETNSRISKLVETMPSQRRKIFKMSRYEHLSNKDIAERMNLSVRTVEKHIVLALQDLRKSFN